MSYETDLPPGTPVRVTQSVGCRQAPFEIEVVGVVERWEQMPTGSWYSHGRSGKLWLQRLHIRKSDGEETSLNISDTTRIARIEAAPTDGSA